MSSPPRKPPQERTSNPAVVGRGGLKLEAAIERFQLAARISGARALDIGASTGGFTEALLRHGAARVTAVDVGRDQLHPSLRSDPRVENLEGVHWKTLALEVAAGPYDFFTVDVSFVAARTMLRSLAFRLRDGAEGVVLVKPQFELSDKQLKGGIERINKDPNLRRLALDAVRAKAESLGFVLVASADSPVAGGTGTIEMLAHLRFVGRSERLPQPGEKKSERPQRVEAPPRPNAPTSPRAATPPARATTTPRPTVVEDARTQVHEYFAVAAPGLEPVLVREVSSLAGVARVREVKGGVEFAGPLEVCYRANLWLRTATRVLLRIGELEAREFPKLRRRAAALGWKYFLDAQPEWNVSASKSRLYHTGAIAENLALAVADAVGKDIPSREDAPACFARGVEDRWTFSVDTSGELLHRRGWRHETAHAPMRETLAAGLILLSKWDPATPFVDPMCGAGTFAIEACALAMRIPPGLSRRFAFERWPIFDAALYAKIVDEARAQVLAAPPAPIVASDHDAAAVAAAERNADRAKLRQHIRFSRAELRDVRPPSAPAESPSSSGLVLINPPYGRRLAHPAMLRGLYTEIGHVLRAYFGGWRAGIVIPDRKLESAIGMRPVEQSSVSNGGLRVRLCGYVIQNARR
jgi:putative N6-adenine-specific DNA methylase